MSNFLANLLHQEFGHYEKSLLKKWVNTQISIDPIKVFDSWVDKPEIKELLVDASPVSWLSHYVKAIVALKDLSGVPPRLTNLFVIGEISDAKLQCALSKPFRAMNLHRMKTGWSLNIDLQRYKSCIGNREDSSAWLEAIPIGTSSFTDEEYRIISYLRIGMAFPEVIRTASLRSGRNSHTCFRCSNDISCPKTLFDDRGYHFAHGCKKGSGQFKTHDMVRDALYSILKNAGKFVEREVTLQPLPSLDQPEASSREGVIAETGSIPAILPPASSDTALNPVAEAARINAEMEGINHLVEEASRAQPTARRPDIVIFDSSYTCIDVSITNPCQGIDVTQPAVDVERTTGNSARNRTVAKQTKYSVNRITDGEQRTLIPFVVEFFGKMNPAAYKFIRELSLSCPQGGKGERGVQLRTMWFRSISCTLQRMHAINFKRNLAFAKGELKSSNKMTLSDMIDDCIHVNAGSFSYFNSRESD